MKRTVTLVAAGLLVLSLAACGGQSQQTGTAETQVEPADTEESEPGSDEDDQFVLPPIPNDLTGGQPWMDSCVEGNVTADTETSPTDDFFLYVNKDALASNDSATNSFSVGGGACEVDVARYEAGETIVRPRMPRCPAPHCCWQQGRF